MPKNYKNSQKIQQYRDMLTANGINLIELLQNIHFIKNY